MRSTPEISNAFCVRGDEKRLNLRAATRCYRRITLCRYSPRFVATRFNYEVSDDLIDRLTEERRNILQPIPPRNPPKEALASG